MARLLNQKVSIRLGGAPETKKQAGTGPSRRHIQGSKIAKGHQSFKVFSSTALKFFLKSLTTPKKIERGDPSGFFYTQSVAKPKKKLKGGPFGEIFFSEKSLAMPKKLKGGTLWSRPALYVMRETFWFCSLGQQVKFCRTFGRTILVSSSGLKKTLTKSHDYSRLFSLEKRRLKNGTSNQYQYYKVVL